VTSLPRNTVTFGGDTARVHQLTPTRIEQRVLRRICLITVQVDYYRGNSKAIRKPAACVLNREKEDHRGILARCRSRNF
jgi:hypothetical protein